MGNPEIKNWFTGAVIVEAGKYANIREAVEKSRANLSRADLSGADLSRANLSRADLSGANLSRANLSRANLSRANLSGADLSGADLSGANLSRADLSRANLYEANLSGADLSGANLSRANLSRADLSGADLSGANLYEANLYEAKNFKLHFQHCPQEGSFIAWKKAQGYLLKIVIPNDAKRTSCVINRKCRAEYVKTIAIFDLDGKQQKEGIEARGLHDSNTIYQVGRITKADKFDPDIFNDCSHGIHFFPTREEAEEWCS